MTFEKRPIRKDYIDFCLDLLKLFAKVCWTGQPVFFNESITDGLNLLEVRRCIFMYRSVVKKWMRISLLKPYWVCNKLMIFYMRTRISEGLSVDPSVGWSVDHTFAKFWPHAILRSIQTIASLALWALQSFRVTHELHPEKSRITNSIFWAP